MTESEVNEEIFCPYCGSENDCDHFLLYVDLTFRQPLGGALYDVFKGAWRFATDKINEDEDEDEGLTFDRLLDVVSSRSDSECNYVNDEAPGQTSEYCLYYSKHAPTVAEISEIKDDLYSAVDDQELAYLSPYKQAEIIWKAALDGKGDFKSTQTNLLEIIVKSFNLALLPIRLQTEMLVRLVDTSSDTPEVVQKISVKFAHEIYGQLVNFYPNKLSSIQSYLNKYVSFAREKVIWRHLGYAGAKERIPDADMQGALLLCELLAKE